MVAVSQVTMPQGIISEASSLANYEQERLTRLIEKQECPTISSSLIA